MTTFLDLPVECRLMVQEFYEADRRLTFDKVLKELFHRTRKREPPATYRSLDVRHTQYGYFEISYTPGDYCRYFYMHNSPRSIWTKMDFGFGEERSIRLRKIHFLL